MEFRQLADQALKDRARIKQIGVDQRSRGAAALTFPPVSGLQQVLKNSLQFSK